MLTISSACAGVTVSGKIRDRETGESIPGVSVALAGTKRGAVANVEGFFSIPNIQSGSAKLTFTALGYQRLEKNLTLEEGKNQNLAINLIPEAVQMEVVVVETETEELEYAPKVARVEMTTKELSRLPQLAEPDLFRSLQVLPGILSTSDFSSELNIWGGSSDQNLILLNGIEVYKPTHLGGIFSVFNMDAVKDVKLIKGGFGAKYGGRLSAVVDIADREGNRNDFRGKVGMSFLSSGASFEGPFPKGTWLVAGRRTYVDAATELLNAAGVIDAEFPYYFYDFNAKVTRDFANGDRLTPSVYSGQDVFKISSDTDDRIRMKWGNTTYSLPFIHVFSPKLFSRTTVAGSFFHSNQRFETGDSYFSMENELQDFTVKTDLTHFANARNTLEFGGMAKVLSTSLDMITDDWPIAVSDRKGSLFAAYLSDNFRLTETWTVTPGVRYEYFTLSKLNEVLPRFSVRKDLSESSNINAAWGMYSQYLQLVRFGEGFASIFDNWVPIDENFDPNRGQQVALTYENRQFGPMKLTTDVYYKKFNSIIETDYRTTDDGDTEIYDIFVTGDGYAFGWDLLLEGNWKAYDFMVGYGLGSSKRSFDHWDSGLDYPAPFDRLHNTNLFVSRTIGKYSTIEIRFNYGTGQPITESVGAYTAGLDLPPQFFVPGRKNGYRIPSYLRLDVAYRARIEYDKWTLSPFVEILNLTDHENVLSSEYDLSTNPPTREEVGQLPFLPSIGFTVEF